MLICVNEGIFEFDQEKEITNKIKDEVDNKRFDLKIIGTTLEARKNWAKT